MNGLQKLFCEIFAYHLYLKNTFYLSHYKTSTCVVKYYPMYLLQQRTKYVCETLIPRTPSGNRVQKPLPCWAITSFVHWFISIFIAPLQTCSMFRSPKASSVSGSVIGASSVSCPSNRETSLTFLQQQTTRYSGISITLSMFLSGPPSLPPSHNVFSPDRNLQAIYSSKW